MVRRRPVHLPVCALALTLVSLPAALAGVDVQIGNGDKVSGTVEPGSPEVFRVSVPKGAKLVVSVKGKKKKGSPAPNVTFRVLDSADAVVVTGTPKGAGAKAKLSDVAASDEYRIEVSSTAGAGLYQLKAKWKSPTKEKIDLELDAGLESSGVEIAIDRGALVTLSVKPAKGSEADPYFDVLDPDSGDPIDLPDAVPGETNHKVKKFATDVFGRVLVRLRNDGAAGAVKGAVVIKPPKPNKAKVDLTDAVIGPVRERRSRSAR